MHEIERQRTELLVKGLTTVTDWLAILDIDLIAEGRAVIGSDGEAYISDGNWPLGIG